MMVRPYRGDKYCDLHSTIHVARIRLKLARTDRITLYCCRCHFNDAITYLYYLQHDDERAPITPPYVPPCVCRTFKKRISPLSALVTSLPNST